ncbi:hypothetical protein Ciccas_001105 [Cichlidogyrus casuarinus]|uniref:FERM domain-containing protein n=1 Tax=Cichlidogyrus casuarinus TaxID=1844966 RepID=A0ABD2QL02_9PLAT
MSKKECQIELLLPSGELIGLSIHADANLNDIINVLIEELGEIEKLFWHPEKCKYTGIDKNGNEVEILNKSMALSSYGLMFYSLFMQEITAEFREIIFSCVGISLSDFKYLLSEIPEFRSAYAKYCPQIENNARRLNNSPAIISKYLYDAPKNPNLPRSFEKLLGSINSITVEAIVLNHLCQEVVLPVSLHKNCLVIDAIRGIHSAQQAHLAKFNAQMEFESPENFVLKVCCSRVSA